ncbi:MAG: hypothetical protein M1336_02595 [Deltaproteobacteria bacterium]|jgi:hypothetical protein|nr:hypothetical protein [Deltaproteobacteria bacterium]
MRKFCAGALLGLLAAWGVAAASQGADHDGWFWNKLDAAAKTGYVSGYGDAMQLSASKLAILHTASQLFHWKGGDRIIGQLRQELVMSALKPSDAISRLDALYSNPKYRELDLGTAIQMLAMRDKEPASRSPKGAGKP